MFYSDAAIETLISRIGWAYAIPPSPIHLSTENALAASGRYVADFHRIAIVENVSASQPQYAVNMASLQSYLQDLKRAAVRKVLARVFDSNERAYYRMNANGYRCDISNLNYSSRIVSNPNLFDNAIGFQLAYDVMEIIATSIRTNATQRKNEISYQELKAEQDGYTDERGRTINPGVKGNLNKAINDVIDILFPPLVGADRGIRDRSWKW